MTDAPKPIGSRWMFRSRLAGYSGLADRTEECVIADYPPGDAPHHQAPGGRFAYIVQLGGVRLYATERSLSPLDPPSPESE